MYDPWSTMATQGLGSLCSTNQTTERDVADDSQTKKSKTEARDSTSADSITATLRRYQALALQFGPLHHKT